MHKHMEQLQIIIKPKIRSKKRNVKTSDSYVIADMTNVATLL
jgi:hypothetical protein